jgi:hypothetical protein
MTQHIDDAALEMHEVENTATEGKKRFSPPKWAKPVFIICGLVVVIWAAQVVFTSNRTIKTVDTQAMAPQNKKEMEVVGLSSTEEYSQKIDAYADKQVENAAKSGRSYVAPVTPAAKPVMSMEKTPEPAKPEVATPKISPPERPQARQNQANRQKGDQQMAAWLNQLNSRLVITEKPTTLVLNKPAPNILRATSTSDSSKVDVSVPPGIKAGDILYSINRITLDSDAPGPAMVEIIDGPYAGGKAIGNFKRLNEHLTLEFSTITMPSGTQYSIKGYAIDPRTDRTAVRSSVDSHTLERWFKFAGAKFLEGFGSAIQSSGSSSYSNAYGGGYYSPKLDLNEQLWVAGGKVGEGAARVFERDFDVPPTVILKSGTEIGILIVSVGRLDQTQQTTRKLIEDQQAATQKREDTYYNTHIPPQPAVRPGYGYYPR